MNIGIDHGYYAIKTRHFSFPAGISEYSHEPYTLQNTLEYGGKVLCLRNRQAADPAKQDGERQLLPAYPCRHRQRDQTARRKNRVFRQTCRGSASGRIWPGEESPSGNTFCVLPSRVCFKFEGIPYKVTIEDVKLFPQGYSAIAIHPELIRE